MLPKSFQLFLLALLGRLLLFVSLLKLGEIVLPFLGRGDGCWLRGLIGVLDGVASDAGVVAVVVDLVVDSSFVLCFCEYSDLVVSVAAVSYVYLQPVASEGVFTRHPVWTPGLVVWIGAAEEFVDRCVGCLGAFTIANFVECVVPSGDFAARVACCKSVCDDHFV